MGTLDFNSEGIEPSAPLDAIPANTYPMKIKWTERKSTKKGDGELLQLQLEVMDGDYKGRSVFDRLNLWNPNSQAVDIAQRTLAAICHAIGVTSIKNHEDLRGKKVLTKITLRSDEKYGESNEVKGYSKLTGETTEVTAPVETSATPPWAAKK